jgi:hypothetical protein
MRKMINYQNISRRSKVKLFEKRIQAVISLSPEIPDRNLPRFLADKALLHEFI